MIAVSLSDIEMLYGAVLTFILSVNIYFKPHLLVYLTCKLNLHILHSPSYKVKLQVYLNCNLPSFNPEVFLLLSPLVPSLIHIFSFSLFFFQEFFFSFFVLFISSFLSALWPRAAVAPSATHTHAQIYTLTHTKSSGCLSLMETNGEITQTAVRNNSPHSHWSGSMLRQSGRLVLDVLAEWSVDGYCMKRRRK